MGKSRKASSKGGGSGGNEAPSNIGGSSSGRSSRGARNQHVAMSSRQHGGGAAARMLTLREWLSEDNQGCYWVLGCVLMGGILGFAIGAGWGEFSGVVSPWRQNLGNRIRSTAAFQLVTFQGPIWDDLLDRFEIWAREVEREGEAEEFKNPSHPRVFRVLREAVVREKGGYVHHDLGFLVPAPSGASRGLGMVRDNYHKCQTKCLPGIASEKQGYRKERMRALAKNQSLPVRDDLVYRQEEVLIRIPLSFQMRRSVALDALTALIPADAQRKASLHELDDAALLVLHLAHERGVGRNSRWLPYVVSLPAEPSCGYSIRLRPYILDSIDALRDELDVDVQGWPGELVKAAQYADRIAEGLNRDFGLYLKTPDGVSSLENIQWALCQVASRATAGDEKHGSLRLVPLMDLINHDSNAGGFVELTGKERLENGDFVDAKEEDSGTFVVRSLRHGRRKALRRKQELLANYNVPHYSPLDWLVSLGFVPPERWEPWQKIEPVLPRVRRDGPFAEEAVPTEQAVKEHAPTLLQSLRHSDL